MYTDIGRADLDGYIIGCVTAARDPLAVSILLFGGSGTDRQGAEPISDPVPNAGRRRGLMTKGKGLEPILEIANGVLQFRIYRDKPFHFCHLIRRGQIQDIAFYETAFDILMNVHAIFFLISKRLSRNNRSISGTSIPSSTANSSFFRPLTNNSQKTRCWISGALSKRAIYYERDEFKATSDSRMIFRASA